MTVRGIDISADQGEFDWEARKDKIGFAIIRATSWAGDELGEDPQFARNWKQAWDVFGGKLVRVAYHYTRPGVSAPVEQAKTLTGIARKHGLVLGDHFALDFEEADGEPPAYVARWSRDALQAVNDDAPRRHRVLAYMDPSWAAAGNADQSHGWHLWIANYGVTKPAVPAGWKTYAIWQFTDTPIDRDVWNGDHDSMLTFFRMPAERR